MPRFRFNCEHIDGDLAGHLVASLELAGPPAEALRSRFGARPKENFIGDTRGCRLARSYDMPDHRCTAISDRMCAYRPASA